MCQQLFEILSFISASIHLKSNGNMHLPLHLLLSCHFANIQSQTKQSKGNLCLARKYSSWCLTKIILIFGLFLKIIFMVCLNSLLQFSVIAYVFFFSNQSKLAFVVVVCRCFYSISTPFFCCSHEK